MLMFQEELETITNIAICYSIKYMHIFIKNRPNSPAAKYTLPSQHHGAIYVLIFRFFLIWQFFKWFKI